MGGRDELPVEGPIAIVVDLARAQPLVEARGARRLRGRARRIARGLPRATRPCAGIACSRRTSSTGSCCTPRSRASSGTSGRAIPASTSAPAGRSEAPARDGRRANGRGRRRRRAPGARARRGQRERLGARRLSRVRGPRRRSKSASQGLRQERSRWRYVERARPGEPSSPEVPSFPYPATTRPSGAAPSSRRVRPAWFSKPAIVLPGASASVLSGSDVSDHARVPGHGLVWKEPHALEPGPVPPAIPAAEQLIAAADREERDAVLHGLPDRVTARREVRRDHRLLAILAAAHVEEVVRRETGLRPTLTSSTPSSWPRAASTALEHGDVAAVRVDVEVLGIEMADADDHG